MYVFIFSIFHSLIGTYLCDNIIFASTFNTTEFLVYYCIILFQYFHKERHINYKNQKKYNFTKVSKHVVKHSVLLTYLNKCILTKISRLNIVYITLFLKQHLSTEITADCIFDASLKSAVVKLFKSCISHSFGFAPKIIVFSIVVVSSSS